MTLEQVKELRALTIETPLDRESGIHYDQEFYFWAEGEKEFTVLVVADFENNDEYNPYYDYREYTSTDWISFKVYNTEGDVIELDEKSIEELQKIILEKS